MEIIEMAQLVTGIATIIVASVLMWQMVIQKRTLDIAHNDADAHMSLTAMDTRSRTNEWFAEKCTSEMLEKFDKGLDSLNEKERLILQTYYRSTSRVLATEWRLGRLIDQPWYYKNTYKQELMFHYKAFREIFLQNYNRNLMGALGEYNSDNVYQGLMVLGKEAYEEVTGEKLNAPNLQ
tara:strand:+ start:462 stop:998 length:537 start_codon:yes stop_codon:yes gene_type:complete